MTTLRMRVAKIVLEGCVMGRGAIPTADAIIAEVMGALNEYSREEWWDVCRKLRPDMTREQFEADWEEFSRIKAIARGGRNGKTE